MCVCLCVCVRVPARARAYALSPEVSAIAFFLNRFLVLESGPFTDSANWLASKSLGSACAHLFGFLHETRESKLRFLTLCGKHLTHGAISTAHMLCGRRRRRHHCFPNVIEQAAQLLKKLFIVSRNIIAMMT